MHSTYDILAALSAYRIIGQTEKGVQDGIEYALTNSGIAHSREHRLSDRDRIDFLIGNVGVEVKIKGSRAPLIRQLGRYSRHGDIEELILASSVRKLLHTAPDDVLGVPVHKHLLQGGTR